MSPRVYNIVFHTHTISGIIISALLYVIFFTGTLSFLRDEINAWERNEPIAEGYFERIDFDRTLKQLEAETQLYSRDINFSQRFFERRITTFMSPPKDTTLQKEARQGGRRRNFFYLDTEEFAKRDYTGNYSMGELFYRLHFFAPLNFYSISGYYLAGLVSLLFLFAVVTGIIVHWNKIVSAFFVFRPGAKWKTIWTDAHVALGVIGLPYQFMFAFTGVYFIVGYSVMLAPVKDFLFDGNADKMNESMVYEKRPDYPFEGKPLEKTVSYNTYIEQARNKWPDMEINGMQLINYGDANMHVKVMGVPSYNDALWGGGHVTYRVSDNIAVDEKDPYGDTPYIQASSNLLARLHFGDFGGYGMKIIYLVLGFVTCFVILSGVMIWLVARDKKNVSSSKRTFNTWLVHIYMAVCLGMYPVTAFTFITVKLFADDFPDDRKGFIYAVFFWSWLVLALLLLLKRNTGFINRATLFLGGALGLLVPVVSGIKTGNWPWISLSAGYSQIFVVDVFWISLSVIAFAVLLKMRKKTGA